MISVVFKYVYRITKTGKDDFQYVECEIKGHSLSENARTKLEVCSGVSAIVNGFWRLVDDTQYDYKYDKGYFHTKVKHSVFINSLGHFDGKTDRDTNYALNTMVCQLYEIYRSFPQHFSRFELIELKEFRLDNYENNNYKEQTNAKTRKQWRKEMGLHSCEERISVEENIDLCPLESGRK